MATRKMRVNAAKQAKRDRDNAYGGSSRSRIHHSSCRCPNCGGHKIADYRLVDASTGEVVDSGSFCSPADKKELH